MLTLYSNSSLSNLLSETEGQFEQLLDQAQLLAALVQEAQKLTCIQAIRVLAK